MDRVNEKSIHLGKNMTDQSLSPARLEEMAVSAREWAMQRGTVENYPATARAHIRELADALLSKTRTPVAEDSLAVQALKSAQNNIAARRPPGSSDPQSPRYDHDAFLWDYYQRAIDSLALASAPVADGITPAGMKEICPACGHQFACFHNPYIDELRAALASVPLAKPKRAPLDDWRVQAIAECLEAEWDEMSPDLAEANARIIVGYLIDYENESAQIEAANAEGSLEPVVQAVRNLREGSPAVDGASRPHVELQQHAPDSIRALIAKHTELMRSNDYGYFELARTRQTGWMAWLCSHPVETHPDRKILARGQGETPDDACREALADFERRSALREQAEGQMQGCNCATCRPHSVEMRMILCSVCGDKRCPRAADHRNACAGESAREQGSEVIRPPGDAEKFAQEPATSGDSHE
ncbi:Uncharacterised protein [Achromobacter sp. 2789STDY5608633]|nr:Uncharacterised protein [Achromobacter sp. 2789STDY5608633]